MPSQTALLDRDAPRVAEAVASLRDQRFLPRLWEKDASLWSPEPAAQEAIRNRLGWLSIIPVMARQAGAIRRLAAEVREAGFTHALLLGMGGSSLFAEVCRATFGVAPGAVDLAVLDTTDPAAIRLHQRRCPPERLCVVVSSKSGSTSEVSALSKYFYGFLTPLGNPGDHCLAITDAGTPLETQAETLHFRRVLAHGSGTGSDVGGRFSALTYFGLVPAALLGMDISRLLQRAEAMLTTCGSDASLETNPAVQLGAALAALARAGRDKATLLCASPLAGFGAWAEQLIAESVGKQGQGIVPVHGEPLQAVSSYGADRLFLELQLASEPDAALATHAQNLADAGHPVIRVQWDDRYDLGGEVVKWCLATTIAGSLLGVNPFDEPNVQESKTRTSAVLDAYVTRRAWPAEPPVVEGTGEAWGGTDVLGASLEEGLRRLLSRLAPDSYVAVLSFLPRRGDVDAAVATFRRRVAAAGRVATTLGIGPRYLHSAGQLHKGGPRDAAFIVLTAEDPVDAPIPGWPYSFSVLKRAQAYGDVQALMARGRRVVWAHLGRDPAARLDALSASLGDATS